MLGSNKFIYPSCMSVWKLIRVCGWCTINNFKWSR